MVELELNIGDNLEWIKGDNLGVMEEIVDITDEFYIFKSDRQIYKNVVNEYMMHIGNNIVQPTIIQQPTTRRYTNNSTNNAINTILDKSPKTSYNLKNVTLTNLPIGDVIKVLYTLFDSEDVNNSISRLIQDNLQSITKDILNTIKAESNVEIVKEIKEE